MTPLRSQTRFMRYRYRLPYGMWTCPDGRQVLFNRKYQPIFSRHGKGEVIVASPTEQIGFDSTRWFYSDSCSPWGRRPACKAALVRCRVALAQFIAGDRVDVWVK